MAYIVSLSDGLLNNLFDDNNIIDFIDRCKIKATTLELGEAEKIILNEDVFCIAMHATLKPESVFESHKKYIDVHIVLDGCEKIELLKFDNSLECFESDIDNDYYLYNSDKKVKNIILEPGKAGVFMFEDVHKTGVKAGCDCSNVVKLVVKIKLNLFEKVFHYE
ncbi:MAG: hypothetical protein DIZ80_15800 [endosymbiont of Galathealinum brachiosum]|uniref:YhcH/YjgK/YiaL family protein n=1 Tax=endosymbiont of Galathealinum brachiosum TaxID=2200906 RepID=A0A370DAC9_9GAMM|nr:MAG: hypothetical protein DIZ80_15800 [endosymbiont of Galathealinum brachiosum]